MYLLGISGLELYQHGPAKRCMIQSFIKCTTCSWHLYQLYGIPCMTISMVKMMNLSIIFLYLILKMSKKKNWEMSKSNSLSSCINLNLILPMWIVSSEIHAISDSVSKRNVILRDYLLTSSWKVLFLMQEWSFHLSSLCLVSRRAHLDLVRNLVWKLLEWVPIVHHALLPTSGFWWDSISMTSTHLYASSWWSFHHFSSTSYLVSHWLQMTSGMNSGSKVSIWYGWAICSL